MSALDRLTLKLAAAETASKPYKPEPYAAETDENVHCPKCHKNNDDDARYCDQCGFKLEGAKGVVVGPEVADADDPNDKDSK